MKLRAHILSITILLTVLILSSCGTGMTIGKSDFSPIGKNFEATFNNKSLLTKGRNYHSFKIAILDYFELYKLNADTIHFDFDNNKSLVLTFKDSLGFRTEIFNGKLKKAGYYEIFLKNERKEIPPFIPIIYSKRNISRLRICLTKGNELVIDKKWANDGNILFLAGGGSGRYKSYFKLIPSRQ